MILLCNHWSSPYTSSLKHKPILGGQKVFSSTCVKFEIIARHLSGKGRASEKLGIETWELFGQHSIITWNPKDELLSFSRKIKIQKRPELWTCPSCLKSLLCSTDTMKTCSCCRRAGMQLGLWKGWEPGTPPPTPSASPVSPPCLSLLLPERALLPLLTIPVVRWNMATNSSPSSYLLATAWKELPSYLVPIPESPGKELWLI